MKLRFKEDAHLYQTVGDETVKWTSVTSLVGRFAESFDAVSMAEKMAEKKTGKYKGLTAEEILNVWDEERERSCDMGTKFHLSKEMELYEAEHLPLEVFKPEIDSDGFKVSGSQSLVSGIYPELLIYNETAKICGQSDKVVVDGEWLSIIDYKTNKKIDTEAFSGFRGKKMMLPPVNHLEDCNFNHYQLQLSMYMYTILLQNPNLKPKDLIIEHYEFEKKEINKFGYPIYLEDENGLPIVKNMTEYHCKFLKHEVQDLIEYISKHPIK